MRAALDWARELLATVLYVGWLPGAPGTYGSAVAAAAFILAGKPLGAGGWIAFGGILVVCVFALWRAQAIFGERDPVPVVIDEVAGMWLTFLAAGADNCVLIIVAFAFFRILDIIKPFPIGRLERLPGGIGIAADDLGAGLAAGAIIRAATILVR